MKDGSEQDKYNPSNAEKCVQLKRCTAKSSLPADKPRLRVFIADTQDGVGGVVAAIPNNSDYARWFFAKSIAHTESGLVCSKCRNK